jgi:diadenosine tetraphosphate (Ap4A) HIT family hydrolase
MGGRLKLPFVKVIEFLETKMSMSHIYQPLLIKTLIDSGGSATLRQLSLAFLCQDESQIIYYEDRIKQMPLKVLGKHGIVSRDGDLVTLNIEKLTLEQKAQVKMICEKKLQEYVSKRGLSIWDYRLLDRNPIPDQDYYRVLKESGGKCALCGTTKNERPLHVDHIKPRSMGGKTEYSNLQVLCSKCNLTKSNRDETDFRHKMNFKNDPGCKFCSDKVKTRVVDEFGTVWAIRDTYPVSVGHHLVLPKRHSTDWFTLSDNERRDADALIRILKNRLSESDRTITGFNIGMNSGKSAGQTIFHAHIHLIPRRDGDTPKPRGGVRGVIPEKMSY